MRGSAVQHRADPMGPVSRGWMWGTAAGRGHGAAAGQPRPAAAADQPRAGSGPRREPRRPIGICTGAEAGMPFGS